MSVNELTSLHKSSSFKPPLAVSTNVGSDQGITQRTHSVSLDQIAQVVKMLTPELREYLLDPITFKPLTEAVVDPHGHTFNKSTLEDMVKWNKDNPEIECPEGGGKFDSRTAVPNLYIRQMATQYEKIMSQRNESLHTNNSRDNPDSSSSTSVPSNSNSVQNPNDRLANVLDRILENQNRMELQILNMRQELSAVRRELGDHRRYSALSTVEDADYRETVALENQLQMANLFLANRRAQNLLDATIFDKFLSIMYPFHLEEVSNKNVDGIHKNIERATANLKMHNAVGDTVQANGKTARQNRARELIQLRMQLNHP